MENANSSPVLSSSWNREQLNPYVSFSAISNIHHCYKHLKLAIELPLSSHQKEKRKPIGTLCFSLARKESRNTELLQLQAITTQAQADINRIATASPQETLPTVRGLEVVKEDSWRTLFTRLKRFTVRVDKIAEVKFA